MASHLKEHPIEYEGEYELANGESYLSPRVQPFSSEFTWETNVYDMELMTLCLVNFGQGVYYRPNHFTITYTPISCDSRRTTHHTLLWQR